MPVRTVASWCGGTLVAGGEGLDVRRATLDGRDCGPGDLFVALRGEKADGHDFAAQAEAKGSSAILAESSRAGNLGLVGKAAVIACGDPAKGLWKLAESWRAAIRPRVVAVTGSFGKTTTKDLLGLLLNAKGPAVASPKSFNNALGLPLTILSAGSATWAMALELGSNHPGEIRELCSLARPEVGILTGVGTAHGGLLGGREGILKEKMDLPRSLAPEGTAVIPGDDGAIAGAAAGLSCRVLRFGEGASQDLRVSNVESRGWEGVRFTLTMGAESRSLSLPRLGSFQARNAAAALLAATVLGLPLAEGCELLETLPEPEGGRMRPRRLGSLRILDDSYNSNPEAAAAALRAFQSLPGSPRVAVLGDMLELGDSAAEEHRRLGVLAARAGLDGLLAVGAHGRDMVEGALSAGLKEAQACADWREASLALRGRLKEGMSVLLKGSRRIGLERILADLGS